MHPDTHESGIPDLRAAGQAGVVYTLAVFIIAFAVGAVRVTWVAPRVGALIAVVLETPIVLAVAWRFSRWTTRRFGVGEEARTRIAMGVVAFSALMVLELAFAALVFGEALAHYLDRFKSAAGMLGLLVQLGFAFIPWIQRASGLPARAR